MTQLSLGALGGIHLPPEALEEQRGAWCSPVEYTEAVGPFDVDPFTNPRSTLVASRMCMLERGDDGFGLDRRDTPGTYYRNPNGDRALVKDSELWFTTTPEPVDPYGIATEETRVWLQPPYDIVMEALKHYGHTRFTALLRLDTSTKWFDHLWMISEVIMVPKRDRLEFVPPPGVKASSNPFPHGLFYRYASDVPPAVVAKCYPWPCPRYPWATDSINAFPNGMAWPT